LQRFTQAQDDNEEIIEDVTRSGLQKKTPLPAQPMIPTNKIKLAPGQNKALPTLNNLGQGA
jgi:hypothetical protein